MPRRDDDRPRRRFTDDYDDAGRRRPRRKSAADDADDRPQVKGRSAADDDDYDRRPPRTRKGQPGEKGISPLGIVALVVGLAALVGGSFSRSAAWSLIPGGLGIAVGFVALLLAQRSEGRQGMAMPTAGVTVSCLAMLIATSWLLLAHKTDRRRDRDIEAEVAREEAARKGALAQAAREVQAAGPGGSVQVRATDFARAYVENDEQADRLYKDKVLELSGVIQEVDAKGEDDDVLSVVLLAGDNVGVGCEFAKTPENRARLARLKPGDRVTIRGKCLGSSATIEACVLVE
jgi:hypothetical protein